MKITLNYLLLGYEDIEYDSFVNPGAGFDMEDGGYGEIIRVLRADPAVKPFHDGQVQMRSFRSNPSYNRMNRGNSGGVLRIL